MDKNDYAKKLRKALFLLNAAYMPYRHLEAFLQVENPSLLWEAREDFWRSLGFSEKLQIRLRTLLDERWIESELERMRSANARFISIKDDVYPEKLRQVENPPLGLYICGTWCAGNAVGIVGTRRCSSYGKKIAESLGAAVSGAGNTVVSGGAIGIDAAAHFGSIQAGGKTAAVLGCGLDVAYPQRNRELFAKIVQNGMLVTEYPFGTMAEAWHFPERNRIIVGLSDRVVIVEAPVESGAMITARLAMDLGREVWAVPGHISDSNSKGSNSLLRDGAHVLSDIPEFIETISGGGKQMFLNFENTAPPISDNEKIIFNILRERGQRTIDDITEESKLEVAQVNLCLATLTASGLVFLSGPGRFSASIIY